jgi:hypothetical protein
MKERAWPERDKEREWRERFETSQYDEDEDEVEEVQKAPPDADPELWDEQGVVRRRARWMPVVYYVRRASSASRSGDR